jgi:hypothetical protein
MTLFSRGSAKRNIATLSFGGRGADVVVGRTISGSEVQQEEEEEGGGRGEMITNKDNNNNKAASTSFSFVSSSSSSSSSPWLSFGRCCSSCFQSRSSSIGGGLGRRGYKHHFLSLWPCYWPSFLFAMTMLATLMIFIIFIAQDDHLHFLVRGRASFSSGTTAEKIVYDDTAYFRRGKFLALTKEKVVGGDRVKARMLSEEVSGPIPDWVQNYILPDALLHKLRNHDSIVFEGDGDGPNPKLVNVLGRLNRFVETLDLVTGEQWDKRTENVFDPEGHAVDDLNHVYSVVVDSLEPNGPKEIWLPCGFHNDRVNKEISTSYARIINTQDMSIRVGPKLPIAGGACCSKALRIIPGEPMMICSFAGTHGTHNKGAFLPNTQCYDRVRERWWYPFGKLPYGLDHGNVAVIPAGMCSGGADPMEPARILIFNFRTKHYEHPRVPEILAHDLPESGWTVEELEALNANVSGSWYTYYAPPVVQNTTTWDPLDSNDNEAARDASGVVMANNGRTILNFFGIHYSKLGNDFKKVSYSMIRSFDVCEKKWSIVGDAGIKLFALQTTASETLQTAYTCGGEAFETGKTYGTCFAHRFHSQNMTLLNPHFTHLWEAKDM